MEKNLITKAADNVRIFSAAMVEKAKSGHPGGAMGGADYITVLYSEFLNYDPSDMTWILSLIHISEPTRLLSISYAVFCLKKKKKYQNKKKKIKKKKKKQTKLKNKIMKQ